MWAGASYRKEAIYYLEKYIESGATYEGTPSGIREMNGVVYDLKALSISTTYSDLAKCYEGEYEFDKAIENYEKASSFSPHNQSFIINLSNVYVKKNQLEKAKDIFEAATHSEAYKDEGFRTAIDKYLIDINDKIKRGYIYRPRKRKKKKSPPRWQRVALISEDILYLIVQVILYLRAVIASGTFVPCWLLFLYSFLVRRRTYILRKVIT